MSKFIIPKEKISKMIGNLIHQIYPRFAEGKCYVENMGNVDDPVLHYFDEKTLYAKYNPWLRELQLRREIFETLESYLDEKKMSYVIDWFNQEFKQDAESVTF